MAAGEVRIVIPTNKQGAFDEKGAGMKYAQLKGAMGNLGWTTAKDNATIYPSETWARRDMARFAVPSYARVESVTE